jgi:hypothetical protein
LEHLHVDLDWDMCFDTVPGLKGNLPAALMFDGAIGSPSMLRGLTAATKLESVNMPVWWLSPRAPIFGKLGKALRNIRELHLQPGETELFNVVCFIPLPVISPC